MIIVTNTPEYLTERIRAIENSLTELCIKGTEAHLKAKELNPELPEVEYMVPLDEDVHKIATLRRELLDITRGKNTIMFDKLGRPSVAQVFECDNSARVENYKELLGETYHNYSKDWENVLPCFKRNGRETRYLLIQKYRCIQYKGKNLSIGMFGMPQAHGNMGFTVSYNGINEECDRVNLGKKPGLPIHELTWDEYGWLAISSAYKNFEPHGNTNKGAYENLNEAGAPCGNLIDNEFVNTLTGSGPQTWNLYDSGMGIADIVGDTKIILSGVRTLSGEIQLIDFRDTTGTLTATELGTGGNWKVIGTKSPEKMRLFATVDQQIVTAFHPAVEANPTSYKIDFIPMGSDKYSHLISTTITERPQAETASSMKAREVTLAEGASDSAILRYMGFLPYAVGDRALKGYQYMVNSEGAENYMAVGADWGSGLTGGMGCKDNTIKKDTSSNKLGALLASYTDVLEY